jgi:Holliday junction resolvasome RuvABC endonuclease subunit
MLIGVDPGINGAAAALCPKRGIVDAIDLPTIDDGKRREVDPWKLGQWMTVWHPKRIVIENVHSMPREGVVSAFRFGMAVGAIRTVARVLLRAEPEYVEPMVWKAYFKLIGGDKEASRQLAMTLFPNPGYHLLTRKKDHQRAEAMLIAWWAVRPPIGRNW